MSLLVVTSKLKLMHELHIQFMIPGGTLTISFSILSFPCTQVFITIYIVKEIGRLLFGRVRNTTI